MNETTTTELSTDSIQDRIAARRANQRRTNFVSAPYIAINKGKWKDIDEDNDHVGEYYLIVTTKAEDVGNKKNYIHLGKSFKGTIIGIRNSYQCWDNDKSKFTGFTNEYDPENANDIAGVKYNGELVATVEGRKALKEFLVARYPDARNEINIERGFGPASSFKWQVSLYILAKLPTVDDQEKLELQIAKISFNYKGSSDWNEFYKRMDDIYELYPVNVGIRKDKDGKQITYVSTFTHCFDKNKSVEKHSDDTAAIVFGYQDSLKEFFQIQREQFFGAPMASVLPDSREKIYALSKPIEVTNTTVVNDGEDQGEGEDSLGAEVSPSEQVEEKIDEDMITL